MSLEKLNRILKGSDEVFIIAEIGKNFIQSKEEKSVDEYLANAKELVRLAHEAGADAVKFQTHNVEDEQMDIKAVAPHFSGSDRYSWVKRNTDATPKRFWKEIKDYSDKLGILFFSTPMSRGAAKFLDEHDVSLWKVGSGDILDFVMLDYLASTKKPIIISTGMSSLDEVDFMVDFLKKRNAEIVILHCVSKYPASPDELRLETIKLLEDRYKVPVGFSDHSIGSESAVAAIDLGAKVIEKHFSLDRGIWGSDHKVSMTPAEFKDMVEKIRSRKLKVRAEEPKKPSKIKINKIIQDGEEVFRPFFRKSLVYGQNLKKGALLTADTIYAMRPQSLVEGLPSERYEDVIGKKVKRDVSKYEPIKESDLS